MKATGGSLIGKGVSQVGRAKATTSAEEETAFKSPTYTTLKDKIGHLRPDDGRREQLPSSFHIRTASSFNLKKEGKRGGNLYPGPALLRRLYKRLRGDILPCVQTEVQGLLKEGSM